MKKTITSLVFGLALFVSHIAAQPTLTVSPQTVTSNPGETFSVDIEVSNFVDILSMQFSLNWDAAAIDFVSVSNINPDLTGLVMANFGTSLTNTGVLTFSWFDQSIVGVTVPDGTTIFTLTFDVLTSTGTDISFTSNPTAIEVIDINSNSLGMTAQNGMVNGGGSGGGGSSDLTITASQLNADNGDMICLDISVDNFDNILSMQYSMNFDETVLEFTGIQGINLQDLVASNIGTTNANMGVLTLSWFDQSAAGVTVPNGTVIYQVCFTVIGSMGQSSDFDFTGTPTAIEVIDGNSNPVNLVANSGSVNVLNGGGGGGPTGLVITAPDINADNGQTVCLDVTVSNFDNILSMQFSMNFDPTVLEFTEFANLNLQDLTNGNFGTTGASNGDLTVSWLDQNVTGLTIPDGTVIFQACFNVIGSMGQSSGFDFTGSPTSIEVVDGGGNTVNFNQTNGSVSVGMGGGGGNDLAITIGDVSGDNGDEVCVDVTVENFTNILSMQYSLNFDPNIIEFTSVQNLNLQDLTNGNFGTTNAGTGVITLSWLDNNVTGVTVADGTVIFQLCFTIVGSQGQTSGIDFTSTPTVIEIVDGDGNAVNATLNDGSVAVNNGGGGGNDLTITIGDVSGDNGDEVCVDVTVENFTNILSMQYSLNFDPNIIEFTSIQNLNLQDLTNGNFGTTNAGTGVITLSWLDNNVTGVTVADGTVIFQLCFTIVGSQGQTSGIDFTSTPTVIEIVDGDGNAVNATLNDGSVAVNNGGGGGDDLTITIGDVSGDNGDEVCVDVTVENFTNILSMQYSLNFDPNIIEFTSVQNLNLQDLTNGNFGTTNAGTGVITLSWLDNNVTGVTVADGTVIFQLCFTIVGSQGQTSGIDFTSTPTVIEITDGDGNVVNATLNDGSVAVNNGGGGGDDLTITIGDVSGNNGDEVCVDVTVENFTNILSMQYSLNFDPNIIEFTSVQNLNLQDLTNGNFGTTNAGTGVITLSWLDNNVTGVTVADGTVIFQLCFTIVGSQGQTSGIDFTSTPTVIEITDGDGNAVNATLNDGSVAVNNGGGGGDDLTITIGDVSGNNGDEVCVDVTVENFTNILSMQYSLNFDPNIIEFTSVQNLNLQDLTNGNFGTTNAGTGVITLSWLDNNVTGVTVADGTVIFQLCFTIVGSQGQTSGIDFTSTPTVIEITDGDGNVVNATLNDGSVAVNNGGGGGDDLIVTIGNAEGDPGDEVCVDVTVENFTNILSMQYSLNFDPSIIEFTSVQNLNLQDLTNGNFGTTNAGTGVITLSWLDQNVTGVTVADGTVIFQLCFTIVGSQGQNSDIDFTSTPTVIEITDGDGNAVNATLNDGSVTVAVGPIDGFAVIASDIEVIPGEMFCLDVSVTGFDNILSMQYSMSFDPNLLQFENVQGLNLPDLTNGNFGLSGSSNGVISLSWLDNNVTGISIPDDQIIYQVCFTAIGPINCNAPTPFEFTDTPTTIEVTDGNGNLVTFQGVTGNITICDDPPVGGFKLIASEEEVQEGESVCVDVSVQGFNDIVSMQFSMDWNENILQYTGVQGLNLQDLQMSSFGIQQVNQGILTISWLDNNVSGVNVADDTVIFQVCFDAIGNDGDISVFNFTSDPTTIEITQDVNGNAQAISATVCNGNITITPDVPCGGAITVQDAITDVLCTGDCTGLIDLTVSGGDASYVFEWIDMGGAVVGTNEDLTNACEGTYIVNITSCSGQISFTQSYAVGQPTEALTAEIDPQNVECGGEASGCIFTLPSGGTPNYSILWNNNQNLQNLCGLTAGTYSFTVTDDNNCQFISGPITISEPPLLTSSFTKQDADCFGVSSGSIDLDAAGGTPPYEYKVTPPSNAPFVGSSLFINLGTGTYDGQIRDANGCISVLPGILIGEPSAIVATITETPPDFGQENGSITVSISGGAGGYQCSWTGPSGYTAATCDIFNLADGDYTLTITDANGCTKVEVVELIKPLEVTILNVTHACFGQNNGCIEIGVSGGIEPYGYMWSNAETTQNVCDLAAGIHTVTVTSQDGQIVIVSETVLGASAQVTIINQMNAITPPSGQGACDASISLTVAGGFGVPYTYDWSPLQPNSPDIGNLCDGENYMVTITDVNGCSISADFLPSFEPDQLIVEAIPTDAKCNDSNDGILDLMISGGVPSYNVVITGPTPYSNPNATGSITLNNLLQGDYSVEVTDEFGNVIVDSFTIGAPPEITIEPVKVFNATAAQSGSITIVPNGGVPLHSFQWSNGSDAQNPVDLNPGPYSVSVGDANGCIKVFGPYQLELFEIEDATITDVFCSNDNNGSIVPLISGAGGSGMYTCEWEGPNGFTSQDCELNDIPAGTYTLTVTDECGVEAVPQDFIVDAESNISVTANPLTNHNGFNIACFDGTSGAAAALAVDGLPPYSYQWNTDETTSELTNIGAGNYSVTVTDTNGCTDESEVTLTQPGQLVLELDIEDISCYGDSDGSAAAFVTGGVPIAGQYEYTWSVNRDGPVAILLPSGPHSVTVSDGNGCFVSQNFSINEPDSLSVTVVTTEDHGGPDGTAAAAVNGGTWPFDFEWSFMNKTDSIITQLVFGDYFVIVTDVNDCSTVAFGEVDNSSSCLEVRNVLTPDGDGLNETFEIGCLNNYSKNRLEIFNRWGQLVYAIDNYSDNDLWRGTNQRGDDVPEGSYFYIFDFQDVFGESGQKRGSVTVLRP